MTTSENSHDDFLKAQRKLRETDPRGAFDNAMAELTRTQERLAALRETMAAKPYKATSKDGMVTVTLDQRGDIKDLKFNTAKFRRMAPAELSAALVEIINKARADGRAELAKAYKPFLPPGLDLDQMMNGKVNVNGILDAARERSQSFMAQMESALPAAATPTRRAQ
jgi:DNA-binding protein YbaB